MWLYIVLIVWCLLLIGCKLPQVHNWSFTDIQGTQNGDKYTCVLVIHSCLTLCNHMDYSLSGSSVHGILQARILEWIVMPFTRGSSQPRDRTPSSLPHYKQVLYHLSHQRSPVFALFRFLWTNYSSFYTFINPPYIFNAFQSFWHKYVSSLNTLAYLSLTRV